LSFVNELKRRNVLRIGAAYIVGAWLLIQVAETIFPLFGFDDGPARIVVVVLGIGFVPALIFAWAFEMTSEGLKKESEVDRTQSISLNTGKKLDRMIMVVLALALGYFAFDKFVLNPQRESTMEVQKTTEVAQARQEGRTEGRVESYGDKSIAVLPFVNMSDDESNEYFSDGISEELLNLLAKIPELRVISRSSAFTYKGKDINLAQVAGELNVAHILEGSVRKSGNQVRITAQLIEARSDTHLWSETYDRQLDDIFAIQDEIALMVVEQLKITLLGSVPRVQKIVPEAYRAYQKGNFLRSKLTIEDQQAAIDYFQQAFSLDPGHAEPLVGMADANLMLAFNMLAIDRDVAVDEATAYLDQALRLNPDLADAHVARALIRQIHFHDFVRAELDIKRALVSDPINITALRRLGTIYGMQGRYVEAMGKFQIIIDHDPLVLPTYSNFSFNALAAGDLYMAEQMIKQALEINSESVFLNFQLARVYMAKTKLAEAKIALEREPHPVWKNIGLGMIACMEGDNVTGTSIADELIEQHELFNAAEIYNLCGDTEKAFKLLQQAADSENPDPALIEMKLSWALTSLRNDPRWHEVLEAIGLPR